MNEERKDIDAIEQYAEGLYAPQGTRLPNGWATLTIDMTLMSPEQRVKVYQAEALLAEAGVRFDTGSGFGGRDWELDWSLGGATVSIRPLYCMAHHDPRKDITREEALFVFRRSGSGRVCTYTYCSTECYEAQKPRYAESGCVDIAVETCQQLSKEA